MLERGIAGKPGTVWQATCFCYNRIYRSEPERGGIHEGEVILLLDSWMSVYSSTFERMLIGVRFLDPDGQIKEMELAGLSWRKFFRRVEC